MDPLAQNRLLERLSEFQFHRASAGERDDSIAIRNRIYRAELGRSTQHDPYDGPAHHFVAIDTADAIVAGFRIVTPEHRPLELEAFVSLKCLRVPENTTAQVGGLWVAPEARSGHPPLLLVLGLLKLAVMFGQAEQLTHYIAYTYPHLTSLYRAARFSLAGFAFEHHEWGLVEALILSLANLNDSRLAPAMRHLLQSPPLPHFSI